jgi:hypothetical protein
MADERIIYNGVEVVVWWPERIEVPGAGSERR